VVQKNFPESSFSVPCEKYEVDSFDYKEMLIGTFLSFEQLLVDRGLLVDELLGWMEEVDLVVASKVGEDLDLDFLDQFLKGADGLAGMFGDGGEDQAEMLKQMADLKESMEQLKSMKHMMDVDDDDLDIDFGTDFNDLDLTL
jgi:hypothetical protein